MAPQNTAQSFGFHVPRPQAGQQLTLLADARTTSIQLDFASTDAQMERTGDNLVFSFQGGASITIENFYAAYTRESVPDFDVNGVTTKGVDFFAALDDALMPAAGPAAAAQDNGGRFYDHGNAALMDGLGAVSK